ncbi:MAG TPA: hypothetical protein VFR67_28205 [Pilimelia sp.]|nr:hypothetical protein [Pilimelia sp.]
MTLTEYGRVRAVDRIRTLFGQVMWYVAATAGLFALGAYLGRDVAYGVAIVCYLLAFACLVGMRFAVRSSAGLSVALLPTMPPGGTSRGSPAPASGRCWP